MYEWCTRALLSHECSPVKHGVLWFSPASIYNISSHSREGAQAHVSQAANAQQEQQQGTAEAKSLPIGIEKL